MRWLRANGQKKSYNKSISQIIAKTNKKNLALMWLMRRVEVIALSLRPAEMTAEKYKCKCFDDVRLYGNCWMLASCQWTDINCHLSIDCFLNNQTEHWKEKDREKAINLNFGKCKIWSNRQNKWICAKKKPVTISSEKTSGWCHNCYFLFLLITFTSRRRFVFQTKLIIW